MRKTASVVFSLVIAGAIGCEAETPAPAPSTTPADSAASTAKAGSAKTKVKKSMANLKAAPPPKTRSDL